RTVSLMLPLIAGTAHAGQRTTDKNYWLNEVGPSSQYGPTQTERDWRRAWAREGGLPPAQIAPAVRSRQYECQYQGGPKNPMSCSWQPWCGRKQAGLGCWSAKPGSMNRRLALRGHALEHHASDCYFELMRFEIARRVFVIVLSVALATGTAVRSVQALAMDGAAPAETAAATTDTDMPMSAMCDGCAG